MRVVTALALTVAEVLASMVLRSAAAEDPPSIITPTAAAVSIVEALMAVATWAAVPVRVVPVVALICPVVLPSRLLRSAAASVILESVTASLPRPEMPDAPVEL